MHKIFPLFPLKISRHKCSDECCGQAIGPLRPINLEILYSVSFARLVHNGLKFDLVGTILPSGYLQGNNVQYVGQHMLQKHEIF